VTGVYISNYLYPSDEEVCVAHFRDAQGQYQARPLDDKRASLAESLYKDYLKESKTERKKYDEDRRKLWELLTSSVDRKEYDQIHLSETFRNLRDDHEVNGRTIDKDSLGLYRYLQSHFMHKLNKTASDLRVQWGTLTQAKPDGSYKDFKEFKLEFLSIMDNLKGSAYEPSNSEKIATLKKAINQTYFHVYVSHLTTSNVDTLKFDDMVEHLSRLDDEYKAAGRGAHDSSLLPVVTEVSTIPAATVAFAQTKKGIRNGMDRAQMELRYNNAQSTTKLNDSMTRDLCQVCGDPRHKNGKACPWKGLITCAGCGKPNHMKAFCRSNKRPAKQQANPAKKQRTKQVNLAYNEYDSDVSYGINSLHLNTVELRESNISLPAPPAAEDSIILDSGAAISIYQTINSVPTKKNVKEPRFPMQLTGIGGNNLSSTVGGKAQHLGRFAIVPNATHNLLSLGAATDAGLDIRFDGTQWHITHDDKTIQAHKARDGLYHFVLNELRDLFKTQVNTVTEGPPVLNREQTKRVEEVRRLHFALNHPSDETLKSALRYGVVIGTHLTEKDVTRYREAYGPCPSCLAGKTKRPTYHESQAPPAEYVGHTVHVDIYPFSEPTLQGYNYFLLTIDEFSTYLYAIPLQYKTLNDLATAVNKLIAHYSSHDHNVHKIECDSESVLLALRTNLGNRGIRLTPIAPYQHAQKIERYVQTINQRQRSVLASLTYVLPKSFYGELLLSVLESLNNLPNKQHPTLSPKIIFRDTKLHVNNQHPVTFGTIASLNIAGRNLTKYQSRSMVGIILRLADDQTKNVYAYIPGETTVKVFSDYERIKTIPTDLNLVPQNGVVLSQIPDIITLRTPQAGSQSANEGARLPQRIIRLTPPQSLLPFKRTLDAIAQPVKKVPRVDHGHGSVPATSPSTSPILTQAPERTIPTVTSSVQNENRELTSENHHSPPAVDLNPGTSASPNSQSSSSLDNAVTGTVHDELERVNVQEHEMEHSVDPVQETNLAGQPVNPEPKTNAPAEAKQPSGEAPQHSYNTRRRRQLNLQTPVTLINKLSVKDALNGDKADAAKQAIIGEIKNMLDYKVGHYVKYQDIPRNERKNILRSFMFLKEKTHPDGSFDKMKARLVGDGSKQGKHLYDMISSATVALGSVFLLFNLATQYKATLDSYDIRGAFLNAKVTEEDSTIYLKIPADIAKLWATLDPEAETYLDENGELYLELDAFIYGLKQSPLKFQLHLAETLKTTGYKQAISDECLFYKANEKGFSLITTHVDDLLQVATNDCFVNELNKRLTEVYTSIVHNPETKSYLGMSITRPDDKAQLWVSQQGLTKQIIDKYLGEGNTRAYRSPASSKLMDKEVKQDVPCDKTKYLSALMSLMYLARLTRPDILLAVTYLATKSQTPMNSDWTAVLRVIKYLNGTQDYGMHINCRHPNVTVYCDASHGSHIDGHSHTGYCIQLGGSYLMAKSGKQKTTGPSSTDAEIIATVDCLKAVTWVKELIREVKFLTVPDVTLYQDNLSTIYLLTTPSKYRKVKHLLSKLSFAISLYRDGEYRVEHVPTQDMIVDCLTKPLSSVDYVEQHARRLGVVKLPWSSTTV
jgi:hypothetical protein